MLLSTASFNNHQVLPFIVKKEDEYTEEGSYSLHLFSRTVITKEGKKYRYLPLKFEGEEARFKKRKDAEDYARYRLALDWIHIETLSAGSFFMPICTIYGKKTIKND